MQPSADGNWEADLDSIAIPGISQSLPLFTESSPETFGWSSVRRNLIVVTFAFVVLLTTLFCGHFAANRVAPILR